MRARMVNVRNVTRLAAAGDALISRAHGMPGMGVIYGQTGFGKSTATAWYMNVCNGVYVRAMALWSPSAMLDTILRELDLHPRGNNAQKITSAVEHLSRTGRPLFIDEADYLVQTHRMVETLRDIHDLALVPVVLIGMDELPRKIGSLEKLSGRVAQWVKFQPCDSADARKLATELVEVEIEDDLVEAVHRASGGSVRLIVVGLSRIEHLARARGLKRIAASDWGNRKFHLGDAGDPDTPRGPNVRALRGADE
jgi:DNA transposition AAA+ family ATPase